MKTRYSQSTCAFESDGASPSTPSTKVFFDILEIQKKLINSEMRLSQNSSRYTIVNSPCTKCRSNSTGEVHKIVFVTSVLGV